MDFHTLYAYDNGQLISKKTNKAMCNYSEEGYLRVRISGKEYRGHRIIWEMFNGEVPEGMLIDHIDGDRKNNKIENLRLATRQQNNHNSTKKGESTLPKGVTLNPSGRYRARIYKDKWFSLGTFGTVEEAAAAYNTAAKEKFGEYAKLN